MRRLVLTIVVVAFASLYTSSARAQGRCTNPRSTPAGTIAACGRTPGTFRPQPVTLSGGFPPRIVKRPGTWYAPVGRNQRDWHQYDPGTRTYGPREPNPFDRRGNLSPSRAIRHLITTRVIRRLTQ